jgi:D-alanyl-D-alanine dipeptidase
LNVYQPTVAAGEQSKRVFQKLAFTPVLSGEEKAAYAQKDDMVKLDDLVKNIEIDLRYAGSDNIVGKPVYASKTAYLRKGTADKLDKANRLLWKQGYKIKVWDAYRSQKDHQLLYDNAPDKSVFMDPKKAPSNHTRGAAVDCTLVTLDGTKVDMPSDFDDGTALAYRTYEKCTAAQKKNALVLENAMKSCGFIPYKNEWWHFDDTEYKSYPMLASYP